MKETGQIQKIQTCQYNQNANFPLSTLSSSASSFTEVGIPITSRHSRRECWAFAQHSLSVSTNWSTNWEFTL